ncbi:MAG: TatD family hydrolase, partial [Planctomycetota bacterium]
MELIDIGANLASNQFRSDLPQVIERARGAGVSGMVITGTSLSGSRRADEIAAADPGLWCTAGVHPHDAKEWGAETEAGIREMLSSPQVVAVGECGLDFNRNYSSPDDQRAAFQAQLGLAVDSGLPLFLHQRDAHDEFLAMLKEAWPDLRGGAIVHCFTNGPAEATAYVELGCHIGITGWVTDA